MIRQKKKKCRKNVKNFLFLKFKQMLNKLLNSKHLFNQERLEL